MTCSAKAILILPEGDLLQVLALQQLGFVLNNYL